MLLNNQKEQGNKKKKDFLKLKVTSFFHEYKNKLLGLILSDKQKGLKIVSAKKGKDIPLNQDEFQLLLREGIELDSLFIDDSALSFDYRSELNDQDFSNTVIELHKNYIFHNCNFSGAVFKTLAGTELKFKNCNLQNVQLCKISTQELEFTNCNVPGIQLRGNDYKAANNYTGYSGIQLRQKSKNTSVFSSDFEDEFETRDTKKINKKGILKMRNTDGDIEEIPVLFRKAHNLLGIVFLETCKIGDDFLHKNVIYILDNVGEEKTNHLRIQIHNQIDLGTYDKSYNIFSENDKGEIVIDLKSDETDLVFKFVRPISVDRMTGYRQNTRFGDYFVKIVSEL